MATWTNSGWPSFCVFKESWYQSGTRSAVNAVESIAPSTTPPTTGTRPTTSPAIRIGIVTTLVARQPVRRDSSIRVKRNITIRIDPYPVPVVPSGESHGLQSLFPINLTKSADEVKENELLINHPALLVSPCLAEMRNYYWACNIEKATMDRTLVAIVIAP